MALRPGISSRDHIQGNPDAFIELVKYGDYQCPHCARAFLVVVNLESELNGNLKFVFRNFPLAKIHPEAVIAAIAAEAAALQGMFWEMHDLIFENQDELSREMLLEVAASLDLDMEQFATDLASEQLAERVDSDFESGIRSGVNATPTFFINGEKYNLGWEADRMLIYMRDKGMLS
ncbi:MAG: thioredoxin domain-containing protein [Chitinophagaceae bacterium]